MQPQTVNIYIPLAITPHMFPPCHGCIHAYTDLIVLKEYQIYDAGDILVNQRPITLFSYPGDQALFQIVDFRLLGTDWVPLFSLQNSHDQKATYTRTVSTSLTFTRGQDVTTSWNIGAAFKGLSIELGGNIRHFTERETSSGTSESIKIPVGAHSSVFLYQ